MLCCFFSPDLRRLVVSGLLLLSPCLAAATPPPYEAVTVLLLAPVEGRAVVQGSDGELHLLAVGDVLPGAKARVTGILPDRLVIVEDREDKPAAKQPRTLWLYRERLADGRTRVQILDPERPAGPPVLRPMPSNPQQLPLRPGVKTILPPKEQPKHDG